MFLFNGQSRRDVALQFANPDDPPIMNPNLSSHPFDRRVAIEATRQVLEIRESPAFARDTVGVSNAHKSNQTRISWHAVASRGPKDTVTVARS